MCIFILGNMASFFITSFLTEKSLMDEVSESMVQTLNNVRNVYENGGTPARDIEKLYTSGFIRIRFYESIAELNKNYKIQAQKLSVIGNKPITFKGEITKHYKMRVPITIVKARDLYIVAVLQDTNISLDFRTLILRANILSLIFGSVMMIVAGQFIVKPIQKLSAATKKIAGGDFEVHMENRRNDEIGELIRGFNTMAKELAGMEMMRNNFIADISHEFKTPLTSIEGYAKLLRTFESAEERNEYIDIIISESKRLSAMSGNILLLSRIENEDIPIVKKVFRLDEQIRQVILLCENKWGSKTIDLQLDLDEINYEGNEQLLYQVWLNLFDNAVKFSKLGGIIEMTLRKTDDKIVFSIIDYGKGMTSNEQKRMFEKFYTGDKSRNTDGTGLGLSIVKRIIDMHSGQVRVLSKLDEFTCIKVIL